MSPTGSFDDLMGRLRAGDGDAFRAVFVRYTARLVGLAKSRLSDRLAAKVDPEDVVQSAYKSFFLRHRAGGLEVGDWDGMWGVLTLITLRKVADRAKYFAAGKRDAAQEAGGGSVADALALDREPTPDEAALLAETVEGLFRSIDDADERAVLELSLQGLTASEIADQLGRAERSVRRLRERVRKRLERAAAV